MTNSRYNKIYYLTLCDYWVYKYTKFTAQKLTRPRTAALAFSVQTTPPIGQWVGSFTDLSC